LLPARVVGSSAKRVSNPLYREVGMPRRFEKERTGMNNGMNNSVGSPERSRRAHTLMRAVLSVAEGLTLLIIFFHAAGVTAGQKKAGNDICIAIVGTSAYSNFFLEGVNMAVSEINLKGGVLGKKIKTLVYDDKDSEEKGEKIAAQLAAKDDVIAVVGHGNSEVAMTASIIYEQAGVVFITYGASNPDLTRYKGNFTFRNIPTEDEFGRSMADHARTIGAKKIVIFYERLPVHRELADVFKARATALGIEIIAARSYFKWDTEFKDVIAELKTEYEFDAVLIAGGMPAAAILVRQLREMGADVPVMGGSGLDTPDLWAIAGKAAENIAVPTTFYPDAPDRLTRDFVKEFEARYGFEPDTWAAQGYDALSVLAQTVEKSGSADPAVIASALKFLENWKGVLGTYSFTPKGNIRDKEIYIKLMKNGDFVFADRQQKYESDLFNYIEDFTLRLPLKKSAETLDPGFAADSVSAEIAEQLFLGLTDIDPRTCEAVPELARKWTAISGGRTFIFDMRHDAVWTDGSPVTAHDVLWAIRRNIRPDTKCPDARMLYILENAEAVHKGKIGDVSALGVFAPDDFTVVFRLEKPAVYFPLMAGLPIFRPLPRAVVEKHGREWTELENIQTDGSYMPVLEEKGRGIFLKKNPTYYDAANVSIPEVRYYVITQSSLGLAMYENNELDVMGSSYLRLPSESLSRIENDPALKKEYTEVPHFCTYGYAFNVRQAPVDNPLVRKAISAAIDRRLLVDAVIDGNGEAATVCTRPPAFGAVAPEDRIGIGFDHEQAKKWLAEAGYPEGKGFPELTLLYRKSDFHKKMAEAVRQILEHHLNIRIKLEAEDEAAYQALATGAGGNPPHIFRTEMCAGYPDAAAWMSLFNPAAPRFNTGWENKEFAELVDRAKETSDPQLRKIAYRRAEKILCEEDAVAVPVYFEIYHCMTKPRVKGWYHNPLGGQHIRNWSFEEKK